MQDNIVKKNFAIVFLLLLFVASGELCAQDSAVVDTAKVYELQEVTVVNVASSMQGKLTAPVQVLTDERLQQLNVLQVSDGLKLLSGVTVKDYGGIGGLKSVSVRSLGAAHTAVSYDGVTLTDMQSGQIDIGRFSMDNVEVLSLYNGQSDKIFQPARQYASAAVLEIRSRHPEFDSKSCVHGKAVLKGGSFGLFNPSLFVVGKLSDKLAMSGSVEWMSANGAYPYVLDYGVLGVDSSSVEQRKNSDVQTLKVEATLFGKDSVQSGSAKIYYFESERGLPGATVFYNTENFSSQRLWDRTLFAQGSYLRRLNRSFDFQMHGKYNYAYTRYLDPTVHNSAGKQESIYQQQEVYVSAGVNYRCLSGLSFSLVADGSVSGLQSNAIDYAEPVRSGVLTVLAGKYLNNYVTAIASVLHTYMHDEVRRGSAAKDYSKFSPYVGVSVRPFASLTKADISVRAFYKNIFRLPTFNDLYYGGVGNSDLKPENANQLNVGVTYSQQISRVVPMLQFSVDGYKNLIENKIVAYPSKNLFTWTMLNYGKVDITGLDVNGEVALEPYAGYRVTLSGSYSYQRALNVTDKDGREYGHQIPYTPRVSGAGNVLLTMPWFDVSFGMVWSGHRYAVNQNYAENRLPGYSDGTLSVSRLFELKKGAIWVNVACLNIGNSNYAVVRYFPMPGRSFRATVSYQF